MWYKLTATEYRQIRYFSSKQNPTNRSYRIKQLELETTNTIKDLGVTLDPKMSFKPHTTKITSRALILSFTLRSAEKLSLNSLKIIYCSIVRSIIECNFTNWCSSYNVDIVMLKSVQNKFLRYAVYKMRYLIGEYN